LFILIFSGAVIFGEREFLAGVFGIFGGWGFLGFLGFLAVGWF